MIDDTVHITDETFFIANDVQITHIISPFDSLILLSIFSVKITTRFCDFLGKLQKRGRAGDEWFLVAGGLLI